MKDEKNITNKYELIPDITTNEIMYSEETKIGRPVNGGVTNTSTTKINNNGKKITATYNKNINKVDTVEEITELKNNNAIIINNYKPEQLLAVLEKSVLNKTGKVVEKLKEYGLNTKAIESENDDINKVFEGMKIVLTGTLPTLKRNDAKEMIESRGGKSTSSVSKSTTFVLAGEEAGSKLTKANELGIKVIDEDTFIELCKLSSKEDVESRLI